MLSRNRLAAVVVALMCAAVLTACAGDEIVDVDEPEIVEPTESARFDPLEGYFAADDFAPGTDLPDGCLCKEFRCIFMFADGTSTIVRLQANMIIWNEDRFACAEEVSESGAWCDPGHVCTHCTQWTEACDLLRGDDAAARDPLAVGPPSAGCS